MAEYPYRILIADDDEDIVDFVSTYLVDESYETVGAYDGEETLRRFFEAERSTSAADRIHLVLLDIAMPSVDGFEICRRIRKESSVPIIMLTARAEDVDKIVGLELGADDYVCKPFNPRELLARVRAVMRRSYAQDDTIGDADADVLECAHISLDAGRREVRVAGALAELTAKEFDLLQFLMRNPGRVFSRPQLIDRVWGADYYVGSRTVDVHVRRLREQVEPEPSEPRYIKTVWGVGYKFSDE
jgi:DNA-binding response OmpR family regulator